MAAVLFTVAKKLASLLEYSEVSNLSTVYSGIKWIETELTREHDLLAEDPGLEMNSKELRKWVRDLTDVAQNIEDIVDNFNFNLERREQQMGCMGSAFFAVKDKVARYKIVAEVKQVKEKMSHICENMPDKQVVGFDKDFDALVKLLVEGNGPHPLYTFIFGPCGAGKTTLVKKVYDSDAVKKQFPYPFWFHGPAPRFWESIAFFKKMTIKLTGRSQEEVRSISETNMCRMISTALKGKRYLIVLDIDLRYPGDINPGEDFIIKHLMSDIRKAFPNEMNGSRVVVTCNDKKDAHLFGQGIEVHELGMLSSEEKWKLFLNTWDFDATTAETTAGLPWEDYDFGVKRIRLESPVRDFAAMKAMQYNLISHNIDNEGFLDSNSSNVAGLVIHSSGINNLIFHGQKVSLPNLRWLLCFPQLTVIGGERPLQKLPRRDIFPGFLEKLCLKWSLLEQDPMATLEQLISLAVLKLRCGSFLGKKMVCSAGGFQKLRLLELDLLDELEELTVEEGAMPNLKHLVIRLCNRLKELPQGLLHSHSIEKLEVAGMPDTFNARLQNNKGEDWDKIKHIKSVTVDGIPTGASSSSSSSFQPY
ncbi:hypothetical protein MRB53_022967 [Persea americana]|uniref:Uncharacterized protein n=1 Tax=Persea americana TaxID=3435 RepID=A0ACC2L864_PERAE|nr:hypothetical protein MRB53_022967 [Persea americana]